jgi:hypothetical protein
MIASRRDAQRPLRGAHAHDWIPNHPGSGQSICTLCWATTWFPEAWPTTVSPFVRRAREGRLPAKVLS